MQIAVGTTVLQRGLSSGGLDGIGVYTQALLTHLNHYPNLSIHEVAFQRLHAATPNHWLNRMLPGHFHLEILRSVLTGLPFHYSRTLRNKMDLFHATDHHIPKLRGIPVVATLMDPVPFMRPDWANTKGRKLKNWFFRRSIQWASHYITISQSVIPDLVEHLDIPEEKITPIHLGVNMNDFAPVSMEKKFAVLKKLRLTLKFFLFIGTLQPRKNVARIVEAFEQLPLEMQREYPLVIVGREGWSSQHVVEKLRKLIDLGVAHWLGYISFEDKTVLLQTATALVFPSLYEGFGLPVLEAFASRLPVITSNTSSLPEISGGAAYLVDPLDTEALSDAMKQVVIYPDLFKPLVENGYRRASQMTWVQCAEKTFEVYKKIISY